MGEHQLQQNSNGHHWKAIQKCSLNTCTIQVCPKTGQLERSSDLTKSCWHSCHSQLLVSSSISSDSRKTTTRPRAMRDSSKMLPITRSRTVSSTMLVGSSHASTLSTTISTRSNWKRVYSRNS